MSIILNGRPSTLSHQQIIDLLKQMPASSLETAEVMYSAPPQYHVRGAALNLVMRGIASEDGSPVWQGEVNGSYTQRHYANYQAGTSLLYNAGKFSADMLYSYSDNHVRSVYDLYSHHNVNGTLHEIEQHDLGENRLDKHTGRFGLDFRPDDDNQLSLAYNTTITANGRGETYSRGNFSDSYSQKTSNSQLHNLSFDYTSGFGFKGGMNYTYYKHPSVQFYENTDSNGAQTSFVSDARQRIDAVMAYADQAHALRRDWELTYGAKFYYANDHDYQIYRESAGGMQLYNTDNTLKEYIYDLYMGVGKSLSDRLSFNLSLTGEYYKFGRDDDWAVFPQANLSYMHSPQQILQFSFSSDKRYPSYWEKQDHIGYMNGYAEGHGNPNIKAYNYYSAQLTYVLKQKYIFNMFYNYAPDYAVQLAYQATDRLNLIYKTMNWDLKETIGLVAVVPFKIGQWLSSRFMFQGTWEHARSDHFHDISFDHSKLVAYVGLNNTFNVSAKPDIKIELSANYMTRPMQGLMDLSSFWRLNAGAKWTFADKKAELRVRADDIFDTGLINIHSHRSGQNLDMNFRQNNRSVIVSFAYKFGGYKEKERKEVDSSRFGH